MATDASDDDYYAILELDADADPVRVRRAWRKLAVRWHPDRAGPGATATFQRISAAYTVLSDPAARAEYDRRRGRTARSPGARPDHGASPTPTRRRAPGVMLSRLTGQLNALVASGAARRIERDMIELLLKPDEAAQGGMIAISMRVPVRCPDCGADAGDGCTRCGGTGSVKELYTAWLAVRPDVAEGTILTPSARCPGMLHPVSFRVRRRPAP